MSRLLNFLQNLFGTHGVAADDQLMGAVDLSDAQYCLGLLEGAAER